MPTHLWERDVLGDEGKSMIRVLAACAALLLLPACVSAPKSYSFKKSWSIGTDFDSAWTATVQLFAENNWPVATLEKDSGIIASEWVTIPHKNDACDCGSAGLLVTVHRRQNLNSKQMVP